MVQPGVPVTASAIDLSATYQSVVDEVLAHATLAADLFHVITHATATVDECRRRVQNETLATYKTPRPQGRLPLQGATDVDHGRRASRP